MNPLDRLLAQHGKSRELIPPKSRIGQILHRRGVANTPELERILALPRYRWQDDPEIADLAEWIRDTYGLGIRHGCQPRCGHWPDLQRDCAECVRASEACACRGTGVMHVRPVQAAALQCIHDNGGMLASIRVGGGKTLLSFLAGVILGAERTLLVIPAKLVRKTLRDFGILKRHWVAPKRIHVISYELLARDRGIAELNAYMPDLVVSDESQKFKSPRAACTVRMHRYLTKTNPDAHYVDMSGTLTKRSLMEYHHRCNWALEDGTQPLPRKVKECEEWAGALDENPAMAPLLPGALLRMCTETQMQEIASNPTKANVTQIVRNAYADRLLSTPGVVGTVEQFDGAMSLRLTGVEFEPGQAVREAFATLRDTWCLPDGHPIDSPADLWRHARELIQGMFYKWDPPPPIEWLMLRKEWAAVCRQILRDYRTLESPLMVVRAIDNGQIRWAEDTLARWRMVKDTYKPQIKAVWIDDACLKFAADWAKGDPGIIWTWETKFAERLSNETGLPYYGRKGLCGSKMIEDERKSCIASILANCEGRNLQHFSRNLVVSAPPGNTIWEQMLGRTHRDGQLADCVYSDIVLACYEQWNVLRQAFRDAHYVEHTTKQQQKLTFADAVLPDETEIARRHASGDPLWNKASAEFFLDAGSYDAHELGMQKKLDLVGTGVVP